MYSELSHEQARQLVDVEQVYAAYQDAAKEMEERFKGTMFWRSVHNSTYLYRKIGRVEKSLGARSEETQAVEAAFEAGKERQKRRLAQLTSRLDEMAPVNRALQLGRMPVISARILRSLARNGVTSRNILVAGTNALYAYERLAGVHIGSGLLATGDVDLLFDSRSSLKLVSDELAVGGLLGLLQKVDSSFTLSGKNSFRAVNDQGYMVDLIQPAPKDMLKSSGKKSLGSSEDDLIAVEIEGLTWLANSPKISQTVIDERGYPLRLDSPDPRVFALHKLWLSQQDSREPVKRSRDAAQANLLIDIIKRRLPMYSFDAANAVSAVPLALRRLLPSSNPEEASRTEPGGRLEPDW